MFRADNRVVGLVSMAVLVGSLSACGAGGSGSGDDSSEPSRASASDLAAMFSGVHADYDPAASPRDLADDSALVVSGSVLEFHEGRTQLIDEVSGFTDVSIVATVKVSEVLEGALSPESNGLVYVEFLRSGEATAADYTAALPDDNEAVLYLVRSRPGDETLQDPAAARPAGQPMMAPVNPQGFWMADGSGSIAVMEDEQSEDPLDEALPDSEAFPDEAP